MALVLKCRKFEDLVNVLIICAKMTVLLNRSSLSNWGHCTRKSSKQEYYHRTMILKECPREMNSHIERISFFEETANGFNAQKSSNNVGISPNLAWLWIVFTTDVRKATGRRSRTCTWGHNLVEAISSKLRTQMILREHEENDCPVSAKSNNSVRSFWGRKQGASSW